MPTTSWGYRAAVQLGAALAPALGLINPKIRAGTRARRDAGERLLDWARTSRDPSRPLVWFHAASVGEGLQAESVLAQLRRIRSDCQFIYTHFSPSAEALASRIAADAADYLPYDFPDNVGRLLRALEPDLLVFAKLDVWPELSTQAATTGTKVAIVAATVSPGSTRLRWPARALLAPGYQAVAAAAAISLDDAHRLSRLGVPAGSIQVLGDPRFDSVEERVRAVEPRDPLLRFGRDAPTLVAGSTWPPDEAVLIQAFAQLRGRRPDARLILVPHEPTEPHLRDIEHRAVSAGLPEPVRLSSADGPMPLLLVDQTGVLAALYGAGGMAYVGGGFGGAGLHSVLEPAAWGIPVAFGPHWGNSYDATLLLQAGGATALAQSSESRAVASLEGLWEHWVGDDQGRRSQGRRAREVVERGIGASKRSAEMLAELISSRPLRTSPRGARSGHRSVP